MRLEASAISLALQLKSFPKYNVEVRVGPFSPIVIVKSSLSRFLAGFQVLQRRERRNRTRAIRYETTGASDARMVKRLPRVRDRPGSKNSN